MGDASQDRAGRGYDLPGVTRSPSRPFRARHRTSCWQCRGPIEPGDLIVRVGHARYVHNRCIDEGSPT
jgi:hypothetical protein